MLHVFPGLFPNTTNVFKKFTSDGRRPSRPQPPTQASVPGGGEELARLIGWEKKEFLVFSLTRNDRLGEKSFLVFIIKTADRLEKKVFFQIFAYHIFVKL